MNLKELLHQNIYRHGIHNIDYTKSIVINTLNAHSFCVAKKDAEFKNALLQSEVLVADGVSIVLAAKVLNGMKITKIAGAEVHQYLLEQANSKNDKVFYLGASAITLQLIAAKIKKEFPNIQIQTYSPPYKPAFTTKDTHAMITAINAFKPRVLFVGMTAPKQEKWVEMHRTKINANVIASIGAVFDFYAGTVKRAPVWMINFGLEWLYRLVREPRRMWKRYLINNTKFTGYVLQEYLTDAIGKLIKVHD